jgi:hypothetical protein
MSRTLSTLTSITLHHDFYSDGFTSDILMIPTAETVRLIQRYRLIFGTATKTTKSKYVLLQDMVGMAPLLPLPANCQFRFGLQLTQGAFSNFTDFAMPARGEVYVFENSGVSTELNDDSPSSYPLKGGPFTWSGVPGTPTTVTATHAFTGEQQTVTPYNAEGGLQASFDLTRLTPGIYALTRDNSAVVDTRVYFDPDMARAGVFAIVHLRQTSSPAQGILSDYTLSFARKEVRWKYFVVLKGDHSAYTYTIIDNRNPTEYHFDALASAAPPYSLTDADQATLDMLTAQYPSDSIQVFVSQEEIPYLQATRSFITLGRYNTLAGAGATSPVVQHLPNPPISSAHAAVIAGIDPPNP